MHALIVLLASGLIAAEPVQLGPRLDDGSTLLRASSGRLELPSGAGLSVGTPACCPTECTVSQGTEEVVLTIDPSVPWSQVERAFEHLVRCGAKRVGVVPEGDPAVSPLWMEIAGPLPRVIAVADPSRPLALLEEELTELRSPADLERFERIRGSMSPGVVAVLGDAGLEADAAIAALLKVAWRGHENPPRDVARPPFRTHRDLIVLAERVIWTVIDDQIAGMERGPKKGERAAIALESRLPLVGKEVDELERALLLGAKNRGFRPTREKHRGQRAAGLSFDVLVEEVKGPRGAEGWGFEIGVSYGKRRGDPVRLTRFVGRDWKGWPVAIAPSDAPKLRVVLPHERGQLPAAARAALDLARANTPSDDIPPPPGGEVRPSGALARAMGLSKAARFVTEMVPAWTRASSMVCGGHILGIGVASGIRNAALLRTTADNRARAEISKVMELQLTRKGGDLRAVAGGVLAGVEVVDHATIGDELYALAKGPVPAGMKAKSNPPCPEGKVERRWWVLESVDPDGGFGEERPSWASGEEMEWGDGGVRVLATSPKGWEKAAGRAEAAKKAESVLKAEVEKKLAPVARECAGKRVDYAKAQRTSEWWNASEGEAWALITLTVEDLGARVREACGKAAGDRIAPPQDERARDAQASSSTEPPPTPAWVERGTCLFDAGSGVSGFGVGYVSGLRNAALAQQTSDNRARAELSKVMTAVVGAALESGDPDEKAHEVVRTALSAAMDSAQIIDRFAGQEATVYSLARLDLKALHEQVRRIDASEDLKERISKSLEEAALRLVAAEEEMKRREQ